MSICVETLSFERAHGRGCLFIKEQLHLEERSRVIDSMYTGHLDGDNRKRQITWKMLKAILYHTNPASQVLKKDDATKYVNTQVRARTRAMEHSIQDGIEAGLRPHSTQPVKEIVRAHAVASVIVDQLKGVHLVQHLQAAMEVGDVFSSPPRCRCALDVGVVSSICVPISTHFEVHWSL